MSGSIYIYPPLDFYTSPIVHRGLTGFSPHVLEERFGEEVALRKLWDGLLVAPSTSALLSSMAERTGLTANSLLIRDVHATDGKVYHGTWQRQTGSLLLEPFLLRLPNFPKFLFWQASLTTTQTRASVRLHLVETTRFFSSGRSRHIRAAIDHEMRDDQDEIISEILIPFTFPPDMWDAKLLHKHADKRKFHMSLVHEFKASTKAELDGLAHRVVTQEEEYDRARKNKPFLPDGKTWEQVFATAKRAGGKAEYLTEIASGINEAKARMKKLRKNYKAEVTHLARAQSEINRLALERGWKAAMLGMMQAAELKLHHRRP